MKTNSIKINDIASSLNLSRNTVSKVINKKSGVSQKTIDLVNQYLENTEKNNSETGAPVTSSTIFKKVLLTYHHENTDYLTDVLSGIERELKNHQYSSLLNIVREDEVICALEKEELRIQNICGIISFNIFEQTYWDSVISLDIPSVFIDTFYRKHYYAGKTDIVTVESSAPIYHLVKQLVKSGKTSFGFVGERYFCYSNNQRWNTLKDTLEEHLLSLDETKCIFYNNPFHSTEAYDFINNAICNMPILPQVFFCSSDIFAIHLSRSLQINGIKIPEQVSIIGFDNMSETARQIPSITTIDAHAEHLGYVSAHLLLDRIAQPAKPHQFILCQGDIIYRNSTNL